VKLKVEAILAAFDRAFVEREDQTRLVLLAVLAGHHALLLGPPGTAKSMLARGLAEVLAVESGRARTFEYLLTRFTHPDELFGPISLEGLKQEDYRRVTDGYLPQAEVAFLDEIFKANSAILNSLLGLINERIFHCGRHRTRVPLIAMIGASNEPPDPEGGLGALYDRFLVRLVVEPIADGARFLAMALDEVGALHLADADRLTLAELEGLRAAASAVVVPERVRAAMLAIRAELATLAVPASDRRWRQAVELLRVAAWSSGRDAVVLSDLLLLAHVFGDPLEDGGRVRQAIKRALEAATAPQALSELHAAWFALNEPLAATRLKDMREARLAGLNRLSAEVEQARHTLDAERDRALEEARSSLWLAGSKEVVAEVATRLVTAFLTARVELDRLSRGIDKHRAELTGLDLHGEVLERLRRAQTTSHLERRASGPEDVAVWLSVGEEDPDQWVPVSVEGWLLFESAPRIAGRLQRRLLDEALAEGRALDHVESWHVAVPRLELDDQATFSLLSEWSELRDFLRTRGFESNSREGIALRALSEWLRGAGVPRLPPLPELS